MSPSKSLHTKFHIALFMAFLLMIAACVPVANVEPPIKPQVESESATPTPEVFNPLDPSPTPADSTLPMTCQVTDLNVFLNEDWGYCFAYPLNFTPDDSVTSEGTISIYGPKLDDTGEPPRIRLDITAQLVPAGSSLPPLVDAYLTSLGEVPWIITREAVTLGNEPAEKLEPIPGLLSSQVVMVLHNNLLATLRFYPVDVDDAKPDLDNLTQTVTGSFAFLPEGVKSASLIRSVDWYEFGANISLSYDSVLAPWAIASTIPAIPVDDQGFYPASHPAYAQFRFLGFQGGRAYELPLYPFGNQVAQVMIFQTADFPGYGDARSSGFVGQYQSLTDLLDTDLDPSRCALPYDNSSISLPFLPWINMGQTFCAQPQIIEFLSGKGIRYLSYYAQGLSPVLDDQIFYTFQGLTGDGQFYVSALFPVQTGIFPPEASPCTQCGEPDYDPIADWKATITGQVNQLNVLPEDRFAPSLTMLDGLIESIQIGK